MNGWKLNSSPRDLLLVGVGMAIASLGLWSRGQAAAEQGPNAAAPQTHNRDRAWHT